MFREELPWWAYRLDEEEVDEWSVAGQMMFELQTGGSSNSHEVVERGEEERGAFAPLPCAYEPYEEAEDIVDWSWGARGR